MLAQVIPSLATPSAYKDGRSEMDRRRQKELLAKTSTLYLGNLSFYTTEEQIHELFSSCAGSSGIRRIIMGLDRNTRTPCGFAFVEYVCDRFLLPDISKAEGFQSIHIRKQSMQCSISTGQSWMNESFDVTWTLKGLSMEGNSDEGDPVVRFGTNIGKSLIPVVEVGVMSKRWRKPKDRIGRGWIHRCRLIAIAISFQSAQENSMSSDRPQRRIRQFETMVAGSVGWTRTILNDRAEIPGARDSNLKLRSTLSSISVYILQESIGQSQWHILSDEDYFAIPWLFVRAGRDHTTLVNLSDSLN